MFKIEKFTSRYDAEEDRLHLLVSDDEVQTLGLWLTRRLANELMEMLIDELSVLGTSATEEHVHTALQAWEQSAANAQFTPLPPVPSESAQSDGLVTSVGVVNGGAHFGMVFNLSDSRSACITMSSSRVRQWLGIVHKLYSKAEWPSDGLWPEWITGKVLSATGIGGNMCH